MKNISESCRESQNTFYFQ